MDGIVKKIVLLALVMTVLAGCLTACGAAPDTSSTPPTSNAEGTDILAKLEQIELDWTHQQVYALLGEPDRYGERSVVSEVIYTVDDTTEAVIAFWSEGTDVSLMDKATRQTRALRETVRGKELLKKLKQIQPDWSSVQIKYLLGAHDRSGVKDDFAYLVYVVDDETEAIIDLRESGVEIRLHNTVTDKTTPLT